GGGADEHDIAGLDARQERILLRFVEAMNLVDEDDRASSGGAAEPFGLRHDVANFLDAGEHGAEGDKPRLGRVRNNPREGGFARARWSPENDRLEQVAFDRLAQRLAGR